MSNINIERRSGRMMALVAVSAGVAAFSATPVQALPLPNGPLETVGLNPQPEPPSMGDLVGLNPQPEPPSMGDLVGLNPQPEPPSILDTRWP